MKLRHILEILQSISKVTPKEYREISPGLTEGENTTVKLLNAVTKPNPLKGKITWRKK